MFPDLLPVPFGQRASACESCHGPLPRGHIRYCGVACRESITAKDRFWRHIAFEPNSGCWLWIGLRQSQGYGMLATEERGPDGGFIHRYAHRLSYGWFVGPIPESLSLDHLCRTRSCVNPKHLEPVTLAVNMQRGEAPSAILWRANQCRRGHDLNNQESVWLRPVGSRVKRVCKICQWIRATRRRSAQ